MKENHEIIFDEIEKDIAITIFTRKDINKEMLKKEVEKEYNLTSAQAEKIVEKTLDDLMDICKEVINQVNKKEY